MILNRARTDYSDYRVSEKGLVLRREIIEWLIQYPGTHWVTLNPNRPRTVEVLNTELRLWTIDIKGRLFRSHKFDTDPTDDLIFFFAFLEWTKTQTPHLHLLMRLHKDRSQWFMNIGGKLWRHVVPSGTTDIQFLPTFNDEARVVIYASKMIDRRAFYELHLEKVDGQRRARHYD